MTDKKQSSTSRRDFLKTAAVAATTLSLAPHVHAAGSDTIKVGVIGCGGRGTGAADNVLNAAPNVEVIAIGDVFQYRVEGARKRLIGLAQEEDVKKLGNRVDLPEDRCYVGLDCHEKVINTPGVNYIILATPPGFRPMHLEAAVAAGKNIFTEKPVAVDGPGIRKVFAAYEQSLKKGLAIGAGTQRRHQNGYVETINRIRDGAIGDILTTRAYWNGQGIWFRPRADLAKHGIKDTDLAFQMNNWYHFVWTCGDQIVEQHVHNLDVVNWALGKHPTACFGVGSRTNRPVGSPQEVGNIFDQFFIEYEYDNGTRMHSMCRHTPNSDGNFRGLRGVSEYLVGTKGNCSVNDYEITGANPWKFKGRGNLPYVQEHTDLIESIRSGKPYNELKDVTESTLTAIMGRMAAYTGKVVTWEQALNSKDNTMPDQLSWNMTIEVPPVAVPGKTPLV